MKVKELIEILSKVDPELEIVLASDPEGNSFSPFSGDINIDYNFHDDQGQGEVHIRELTAEYLARGYTSYDVREGGVPCLIMWP